MVLRSLIAALALVATLVPAFAQQQQVRIGIGYGLAFLPLYICEDLKLVEKYAKAAHLDVKVSFPRLSGAARGADEIASGAIDMGPFGTAPLLGGLGQGEGHAEPDFCGFRHHLVAADAVQQSAGRAVARRSQAEPTGSRCRR